jgi:hypothetical protein
MKTENIKRNIENVYIHKGLFHWLGCKYPEFPKLPMEEGDDAKYKFLEDNVKIVNFTDRKKFRCYVIATSFVGDPVIEFKVKLSNKQRRALTVNVWSETSTINDEESRWVTWGTSIDPLSKLDIYPIWTDDAEKLAKKILKMKG